MSFARLTECMNMLVDEYNTPGVDCIVYQEHREIFRYYTGMRDIERHQKVDGKELYIIFSMTKMMTCTCALQLFEQGKFAMDDPLSMYLPEFKSTRPNDGHIAHPITIKDLLPMINEAIKEKAIDIISRIAKPLFSFLINNIIE